MSHIAQSFKEDFQTLKIQPNGYPLGVIPIEAYLELVNAYDLLERLYDNAEAECSELDARCQAQAKALAVVLQKARLCVDGYQPFHPGARLVEVYVPLTPGEVAIIERAVQS